MNGSICKVSPFVYLAFAGVLYAQVTDHSFSSKQRTAINEFEDVKIEMHNDMFIEYTGNTDIDFIKSLIPHHKGAVDMAKIVLKYGTDPEIKAMAERVIETQQDEIQLMKDWLSKNAPDK